MPITFSVDRQAGLITTLYSGHVTAPEYVATYRNLYGTPDFRPGMFELADLREMTDQSAGTAEFRQVALMAVMAHGRLICRARTAILVKNRLQYGLSRMYATYAELLNSDTAEIFEDPESALQWVGLPVSSTMPAVLGSAVESS